MNLLVLGGTLFVGRHVVAAALERGHAVTTFTRGQAGVTQHGVRALTGDRDPRTGTGLAALQGERFDAVIDLSGYVPGVVGASATLLADAVQRYVFVSSVSVYRDLAQPGVDEDAPVAVLADPHGEVLPRDYGALKAASERVVRAQFGPRATIVRPGLIVGPHDPTDRFGYWVARFAHPALLGDRAAVAVAPAPAAAPVQYVDARDLAAWLIDLADRDTGGTYNAVTAAGAWTMADVVRLAAASATAPPAVAWIDPMLLQEHGVEPWVGLPLWLPSSEPDFGGFMRVDGQRAARAGLATRPLEDSIAAVAEWLAQRDNSDAWKHVMSAARERELLAAAGISL